MANHKSSKARIIRNARANTINMNRKGATRTAVKKVEAALLTGDVAAAREALKAARPTLQRTAAKKVIDQKAAARKISRLSARIKKLDLGLK
jgi:small subunit ribosomal protein S20